MSPAADKMKGTPVITAVSALTPHGFGIRAQIEALNKGLPPESYELSGFRAAGYLSDRRMMKAISAGDAIGLATMEGLRNHPGFSRASHDPAKVGVFVGAPPASAFDNEFYMDALERSRDTYGKPQLREFGKYCMDSKPTALLIGLPNNVLCYGSLVFDARGPNDNYTSLMNGGHIALASAARQIRLGRASLAIGGAFTFHNEPVHLGALQAVGLVRKHNRQVEAYGSVAGDDGMKPADGGVFLAVEDAAVAAARDVRPLATWLGAGMASDGLGLRRHDPEGRALEAMIRRVITRAGLKADDVGLVLASATGVHSVDACEFSVLSRVFAKGQSLPALGVLSPVFGNLMEAGGLLEVALGSYFHETGGVPAALSVPGPVVKFPDAIDKHKRVTLVVRTSPWGEYSCILVGAGVWHDGP